jgi:hypothetical protein
VGFCPRRTRYGTVKLVAQLLRIDFRGKYSGWTKCWAALMEKLRIGTNKSPSAQLTTAVAPLRRISVGPATRFGGVVIPNDNSPSIQQFRLSGLQNGVHIHCTSQPSVRQPNSSDGNGPFLSHMVAFLAREPTRFRRVAVIGRSQRENKGLARSSRESRFIPAISRRDCHPVMTKRARS